jgi:hypothetical protein
MQGSHVQGVRITPSGQRRKEEESRGEGEEKVSSVFEPFKQDFDFIVKKLKEEQAHRHKIHPVNMIHHPPKAPSHVFEPKVLEKKLQRQQQEVFGETYTILDFGTVNEMYETRMRRKDHVVWEAFRLMIPSGKKHWLVLVGMLAVLLILFSVSQLKVMEEEKKPKPNQNNAALESAFWWGFLARPQTRSMFSASSAQCRLSDVGPQGTVVDSEGVKCEVGAVNSVTNCCKKSSKQSHAVSCQGCNEEQSCCGSLQTCIQCCLLPDHLKLLKFQIFALSTNGFPNLKPNPIESFDLCTAVCRTKTKSLDIHGKFLNPTLNNCWRVEDERAQLSGG